MIELGGFTSPGSGTFQGLGAQDPSTLSYPARLGVPATASGSAFTYAQAAAHDLDADLDKAARKLQVVLAPNVPPALRLRAAGAVALLQAIAEGYTRQTASARAAAWGNASARLALQNYRVALAKISEAADTMQAQLVGAALAQPAPQRYVDLHWPGGMGVWSWNPNLWGKTEEEARQYELAQAQLDTQLAQAQAAAKAADPGLMDTLSGAVQTTAKAAASTSGLLMFVGVAGAAALAYWLFKDPERGARATGQLAQGGARAVGTAAGSAAKLALL
jgi:hypothetical protein